VFAYRRKEIWPFSVTGGPVLFVYRGGEEKSSLIPGGGFTSLAIIALETKSVGWTQENRNVKKTSRKIGQPPRRVPKVSSPFTPTQYKGDGFWVGFEGMIYKRNLENGPCSSGWGTKNKSQDLFVEALSRLRWFLKSGCGPNWAKGHDLFVLSRGKVLAM